MIRPNYVKSKKDSTRQRHPKQPNVNGKSEESIQIQRNYTCICEGKNGDKNAKFSVQNILVTDFIDKVKCKLG